VVPVFARIGDDGVFGADVVSNGLFQHLLEHVGQQRFPRAGPAHHQNVPLVLGDFPDGGFGPVLKDHSFDGVFRDGDVTGVIECREPPV
jgi:hypothetical protein